MIRKGDLVYVYRYKDQARKSGRPAVVVSGDSMNRESDSVMVVFLSGRPSDLYCVDAIPITGLGRKSYAITNKVSTITKDRLSKWTGHITPHEMTMLESSLCRVLEL